MFNKKKYLEYSHKKMKIHMDENYKKLSMDDFALGKILYNRRCHLNAVQNILEGNADSIHMVVTYRQADDFPFAVHFVNKKDGKWIDNTLGWTYKWYYYYYIREIQQSEYYSIGGILTETQKNFLHQFTDPFSRWFYNIDVYC